MIQNSIVISLLALVFIVLLASSLEGDVVRTRPPGRTNRYRSRYARPGGQRRLLSGYTLGCHSLRHLVGGRLDQLSRAKVRKRAYDCSSCLNRRHMMWAWLSLTSVGFSDLYVRLCSMGIWSDWRIL